jgi:hypothetical protein
VELSTCGQISHLVYMDVYFVANYSFSGRCDTHLSNQGICCDSVMPHD